jgi:hypothetical protein
VHGRHPQKTLGRARVDFDRYFNEKSLYESVRSRSS